MSMEIGKINEGLVRDRKVLFRLLGEEVPSATIKNGEPYFFDRTIIAVLGKKLPGELHTRLRLPMLFFMSPDVPDSCWCADAAVFKTLIILGEISRLRTMENEKFWVSRAIVYAIAQKYPTAVQVVMGP
jgi:hypothetical protein